MASTYSDLKIQLMATGENSGTWGTVTNTNLGTAIEEAIVGSVDVPFSNADVTLTLTDTNASQSARNLRLNLTGTVTTAQNLIVPGIEKIYIVNNGLSQTITVKNSTGTGIAVPAGKTMYVYNDATNVLDAITHLTSLTLATALPVASGGTGSNTATFSGANITSLNASNISSGTLAVARGGTGSSTAAFSGENITSLNASNVSSGTLANARTTASSSNGASTIVTRDASGNFTGATITATTFSGSGASLTSLNASNISTGTLGVSNGGTGATTLTANNVILGNGTSAVQFVAAGTSGNVLTSNGTTWTSAAAAAGGGDYIMQVFTTSGTWTKPAGLKAVKVTVIGGGGGSGNQTGNGNSYAGGGGGTSIEYIDAPAIPGPQPYTVGAGGIASGPSPGPTGGNGGTGGTSSFGSPAFLSATGGVGGTPNPPTYRAAGGVGSNGQLNFAGGSGIYTNTPTNPNVEISLGGNSFMGGINGNVVGNFGVATAPLGYGVGAAGPIGPPALGIAGSAGVVIVEEFY